MNVLVTYMVNITNGVVTAVGDVPAGVLALIQASATEAWERWQAGQSVARHDGNYQVTLYDTGEMEMIQEDAIGNANIIYAEPAADALRATTVEEWLELHQSLGQPPVMVGPSPETTVTPQEVVWQQEGVWTDGKGVHPKDIMPGFQDWLEKGTGTTWRELARSDPKLLQTLLREYRQKVIPPSAHRARRTTASRNSPSPRISGVRR